MPRHGRSVGCPSLHSEARVRLRRQDYRSSGKASMLAMELSKVCRELVHKFTEFLAGVNCDVFQEDIIDWNWTALLKSTQAISYGHDNA